jgi:hypothetical protein
MCTWNGCNRHDNGKTQYCQKHVDYRAAAFHKKAEQVKRETFQAYGGAKCSCCGEPELWVLELDHKNNDGSKERAALRQKGLHTGGYSFYSYLKSRGYPNKDRYKVLCSNCNLYKHLMGEPCYHKKR